MKTYHFWLGAVLITIGWLLGAQTVEAIGPPPMITVTNPNAPKIKWRMGDTKTISWSLQPSITTSYRVSLTLLAADPITEPCNYYYPICPPQERIVATNLERTNQFSYDWSIPTDLPMGYYRIRACFVGGFCDESDNKFLIYHDANITEAASARIYPFIRGDNMGVPYYASIPLKEKPEERGVDYRDTPNNSDYWTFFFDYPPIENMDGKMPIFTSLSDGQTYEAYPIISNLPFGYPEPEARRIKLVRENSLPDGCYTLDLRDRILNWAGQGQVEFGFKQLIGDITGDGIVNLNDLNRVKNGLFFPIYNAQNNLIPQNTFLDVLYDLNYSVNLADLNLVKQRLFNQVGTCFPVTQRAGNLANLLFAISGPMSELWAQIFSVGLG